MLDTVFGGDSLKKKKTSVAAVATALSVLLVMTVYSFILSDGIDTFVSMRSDVTFAEALLAVKEANYEAMEENMAAMALTTADSPETAAYITPIGEVTEAALWVGCVMEEERIIEREFILSPPEFYHSEKDKDLSRHTLRITGVGEYENVVRFLSRLDGAPYYYEFVSVEISSVNVIRESDVAVFMEICFFTLKMEELARESEGFDVFTGNPFYYDGSK